MGVARLFQHTPVLALSNAAHGSPTPVSVATSSLDRLVDDIIIQIFQSSSVSAVLSLRKTSRRYYLLSKLRCIWYARFCTDVLARNLPPPGPSHPLSLLSGAELEQRTLRALRLDRGWPRLSAKTLVSHHHDAGAVRVDQVMFIPGGTELLTVQGDKLVHWLVVSWPGFGQGLKHIGEWTPVEGVPCRIVKDGDMHGVIAVGPREPRRSQRFAKVFSTSLKAPFMTLCNYAHVPGILTGVWQRLLLIDATKEIGGGGLVLLDWHSQTSGTALLPHIPDLFGCFLDYVVFAGHILVVWERCVSVFPIPHVPAVGQVVVEHMRAFMFQEAISRPIGFTTCVARHVIPPYLNLDAGLYPGVDGDMDWDWQGRHKRYASSSALGMLPTLTIAGRSTRRTESVSMVMLVPLVDGCDGREKGTTVSTNAFPFRLVHLPPHASSIVTLPQGRGREEDGGEVMGCAGNRTPRTCTTICLGWSGRGVFVVGRELRLVSPGLLILPPYEMELGPVFETGDALYTLDRHRQPDSDQLHVDGNEGWNKVDFDEGMGRFVVAKERGGFEVVQLD